MRSLRTCIARRSNASPAPVPARGLPAPISSTANGCAGDAGGWTRASSCAPRTTCSPPWAPRGCGERAARELLATGETARKVTVDTCGGLTAREAQIARLARDGLSTPEIGSRLFISPRTVEYHPHRVFGKLDISSRTELAGALPARRDAALPV